MRATVAIATLILAASGSAGWAQPGPNFEGVLTNRTLRSEHIIDLSAGQIVTLTTSSRNGLDTVLTLYGPDGREVAANDDVAMGDLTSRIIYAARQPGRYRAVVSGYANATGDYELDVFYGANVGLSFQARTLRDEIASLARGRTEARYSVDLPPGESFVASTVALTDGLDTTLALIDASGATVAENDDRGDGTLNSQITYQSRRGGRYTVIVGSFSGRDVGDAVVSLAIDPNAVVPFNFAAVERTQLARHQGRITDAGDEQDFTMELAAGQTVLASLDATDGDLDPVLTVNGPDGFPVAMNDDRADGSLNSAVAYTAQVAGTYTFNVAAYAGSGTSGRFALEISAVDASVVADLQAQFENPVRLSGAEEIIDTENFRVHYTLQGSDATTEPYAQAVSEALQRAYDVQIGEMGWAAPVREGNGRFRAYISDAGAGTMGYMKGVEMVFDNPNTPGVRERFASRGLLVVDNDLSEGRDEGEDPMRLMRATVAHEFNHLVQYSYDAQEGLGWLYESTASWIETATMGEDEDAARYAVTDFAAPQLCWTTTEEGHNYGQWTLLQSLADRHGQDIVRRLWENGASTDGLETMELTLAQAGTDIPVALRTWRIQNFARDYVMAPRIDGAVALAGGRGNKGSGRAMSGHVQELGAAYHQIRANGAQRYELNGERTLEMTALGVRNGEVEVTPLGRDGVFDATGYDYAVIMVFNNDVPDSPGACTDVRYSVEASDARSAPAAVQSRMSARHFRTPGS